MANAKHIKSLFWKTVGIAVVSIVGILPACAGVMLYQHSGAHGWLPIMALAGIVIVQCAVAPLALGGIYIIREMPEAHMPD